MSFATRSYFSRSFAFGRDDEINSRKPSEEWRSCKEKMENGKQISLGECNKYLSYQEGLGSVKEMVNILQIMRKREIRIDIRSCNIIVQQFAKKDLRNVDYMLKEMRSQKIFPDKQTYEIISKKVSSIDSKKAPGLFQHFKKEREKDLQQKP